MLRFFNARNTKSVIARSTALRAVGAYQFNSPMSFHQSARAENELIMGGAAVFATVVTLQYGLKAYESFSQKRANQPADVDQANKDAAAGDSNTQADSSDATHASTKTDEPEAKSTKTEAKKKYAPPASGGLFGNWSTWFAKNFYDGGFEDKMTKREAALILGVRESATPDRIKDAHRRIMQINHPDKGGSAYLTAKVNEAKDLLLKGKNL